MSSETGGCVNAHSWYPINLAAIEPQPAKRPATGNLIYPAGRHTVTGEPEAGKGLFAMALAVTEIRAGNTVAWVDLESDEEFVAERLRCFGVEGDELRRFCYFHPNDPIGTLGATEAISVFLYQRRPTIVILDAFAGLADLHGLDSWKSDGVERTYRLVIEPWREYDAATIVIDHVVKSKGDRGRFAAGSERKLGAVDVHIGLDVLEPFGRGRTGRAKISIHKDRFGFLPRPRFGDFLLASDDAGTVTTCGIEPPPIEEEWMPTALMAKVSAYLERQREGVPRSSIKRDVKGKGEYLIAAIDHLIAGGYAIEQPGERGAKLVTSLHAYHDGDPFPYEGTAGNTSPGHGGPTRSPFPVSIHGNGNTSDQAELERLEGIGEEMGLT